jgi:hypothetical protein
MSSNYSLYGDLSRRIYETLAERLPQVEPYSIDEMFLDLDLPVNDLVVFCRELRADVRRITKIPTCIGIGPTKTIAFYGVVLSTPSGEYLPAFFHVSLTHGFDWTDCGQAVSPVALRDKLRPSFSTSRPAPHP